ncbi:hypothetical protein CEXT_21351 [Caerostris extrusa]|uniref:Uncharacterized protein n=1 Tax=Caerostris extrusa TaxID=172846 RepID=A0AAV4Q8S4_CAEEX|nr:hypothetical protein CEXT_21351 [Caerostris extrusa]
MVRELAPGRWAAFSTAWPEVPVAVLSGCSLFRDLTDLLPRRKPSLAQPGRQPRAYGHLLDKTWNQSVAQPGFIAYGS